MHDAIDTVEVYEDADGALHLFALESDGAVRYAEVYDKYSYPDGPEYHAAVEYADIVIADKDPAGERWGSYLSPDYYAADLDEAGGMRLIKQTRRSDDYGALGLRTDDAGPAGRRFFDELD